MQKINIEIKKYAKYATHLLFTSQVLPFKTSSRSFVTSHSHILKRKLVFTVIQGIPMHSKRLGEGLTWGATEVDSSKGSVIRSENTIKQKGQSFKQKEQ